jgi:diphthamide biosynthesis protein 7
LAQADAGGFVSIYEIHPLVEGDEGGTSFELVEVASVQCGGGGLGMATCVDWSPLISDGEDDSIDYFASSRLAVVGADGGARLLARRESGELEVFDERESAHDLEAWAVAWAHPKSVLGGDFIFTGADDAAFKGWDLRCGLDASSPAFVNRRAHGAGVTCISPSPHDPHVVATGSYDDRVRLWDARMFVKPVEMCDAMDVGGGAWRLRWHPERRALACAAMGGGVAIVEWSGCESGVESGKICESFDGEGADASVLPEIDSGTLRTVCAYDGHGSIAYGADWGWKRGGKEDVVVSCSFYDKGLHVWSPE